MTDMQPSVVLLDLNKHRAKVTSQNGEDGMIAKLFSHLAIDRGTFLEMGAGDGVFLSNTAELRRKGWSGVLIEGEPTEFAKLKSNVQGQHLIMRYIDCEDENTLDYWLASSSLPTDFDLFSLDIDGNDLWVWDSLRKYTPKAVIVEYNYTLKPSLTIEYDPAHRFGNDNYFGATAPALCKLADKKGYVLVGWTDMHNLLFVRKELSNGLMTYTHEQVPTGGGWPQSKRKMIPYG